MAWAAPEGEVPRYFLFLGRMHPIILHLPIGMLAGAAILETFFQVFPRCRSPRAILILLSATALGAAVTAICGHLLAWQGGYDAALLTRHRWLGTATAAVALLLPFLAALSQRKAIHGAVYALVFVAGLALLGAAGHFGGSLTHGADYLTRDWPWAQTQAEEAEPALSFHAAYVQPVFDQYCIQCHGESKQQNDLRLDRLAPLPQGDVRMKIAARIQLPLDDDDHMPPEGKPQPDSASIELVAYWIESGANPAWMPDPDTIPPGIRRHMGMEAPEIAEEVSLRPWEEISAAVLAINAAGKLEVLPIAEENPGLRVRLGGRREDLRDEDLAALEPLSTQVCWLDLSNTAADDAALAYAARMPNLERLLLEGTAVTDEGLENLIGLRHLRYLNLHGTAVTDEGLAHLAMVPSLRQVYLWDTAVTAEGAERLRASLYDQEMASALRQEAEGLQKRIADLTVQIDHGARDTEAPVVPGNSSLLPGEDL